MIKNSAFDGNTGHFDIEIEFADSESLNGMKVDNIKLPVNRFIFSEGAGWRQAYC